MGWTSGSCSSRTTATLHFNDVAPVRSLQFGPPDEPVNSSDDKLGAAAMEDLERLFSGLIPSLYQAPDVDGKGNDHGSASQARHRRCAACWATTCYACRRTCCD